jgi:outer membrane receptor protein involved in Fe transport
LFDLERIELLKGPQSTYFGANAIAGALNIVTRKPGNEFEAGGRLLYGQFGQYAAEGAVGGPLSDAFGARIAVTRNGVRDGWIENLNLGHSVPHINNLGGRLTLTYLLGETLDATFKVEGNEQRTTGSYGGGPRQRVNCPPPAPIAPGFSGNCGQALAMGAPLGLDNNQTEGLPGQGDWLSTFEDVLTLNYHLGAYTLTSVTGFFNFHFSSRQDDGLLPVYTQNTSEPVEKDSQFSQEIRLVSPTGGALEYLVGVYFQSDKLSQHITVNAPFVSGAATLPGLEGLAPYLPLSFKPGFTQREHVYSVFGSASWNLDPFKFTAGLRGSQVDKDFSGAMHYGTSSDFYGGFRPIPASLEPLWSFIEGAPGAQELHRSDRALMPSASVQYQITADAMAYLSYTRGFKSGGFNGLLPVLPPEDVKFAAEHVNSYELGLKGRWLDGTVRADAGVFLSNYTGLQSNTIIHQDALNANRPIVRNAAQSRAQGVEYQGEWLIRRGLRLSADVTYIESYYVHYPNATATTLQQYCAVAYVLPYCAPFSQPVSATADLSGQTTAEAPRWSGNIRAEYRIELPHDTALTTEISSYLTTSYSATGANPTDPLFRVPRYALLNVRVSFEASTGHWGLDVIGKNLTDHVIVSNIGGASSSLYSGSKEMRSNVAVQVRTRW